MATDTSATPTAFPAEGMTPTTQTASLTSGPGAMTPPAPTNPAYGMRDMTKVPVNPFTNQYEEPATPAASTPTGLPPSAGDPNAPPKKKNAASRMMDALTAPGMLLDPTSPEAGVSRSESSTEHVAPELAAARLLHERGLFDVGTAAGADNAATKGFSKFATGMIRPESLLLLTGGGIFEGIPQVARAGMSAIFGAQMAHQVVQKSPEFVQAVKQQDWDKAVEIASEEIPTAAMAFQSGLHAFRETGGAIHEAGATARESMAAKADAAAAKEETRVAEAKTGKVLTIRPDNRTLAAPEPDKFAESGGKLVGPNAPAAVEKPVTPVETTPETADAVEDLIMSDKIGGKKVKGATPKPAAMPPSPESKTLYHYTTKPFEEFDPMIGGAGGDFGTHLGTTPEQAHGRMQGAPESPEMVGEDVGGHVRPVYADIKNPIRLEDHGSFVPRFIAQRLYDRGILSDDEFEAIRDDYGVVQPEALRDMLEEKGYDGAVYLNRTEGVPVNVALASQATIGISDKKFLKLHPEIKGNDSYIAFRPEQITSKFAVPPNPEAFAEHGGKFVGKAPEAPAPSKTPVTDILEQNHGLTTDPMTTAYVKPNGERIGVKDHDLALDNIDFESHYPATDRGAAKRTLINQEGLVRLGTRTGRAGAEVYASVPPNVTPEQAQAIRESVGAMGRNGNLMIERADINPENAATTSTKREFALPSHVDDALREIGAHPDQQDIVSKSKIEEGPHKSSYAVEVTENDGTQRIEKIDAHTNNEAMKLARKKFPEAGILRRPEMDETHTPSTKYEVPTGKRIKMPPSYNRPEEDTERHEVAHALVALKNGLQTGGVLSTHHPIVPSDARAVHLLKGEGLRDPSTGRIREDKRTAVLASGLAGIASDEIQGVHRAANLNFDIQGGGDGERAYNILKAAGFSHEDAMEEMHRLIDENIEYLKHPAYASVVNENVGFREKGLSRQFHYSPERLQNMHAEIERRKANGEPTATDNRTSDEAIAGGRTTNVPGGEGEISRTGEGQPQEGQVTNAEKETNEPNLRNRPVVEQNGETTAARDSGESETAATKPAETEEGIVSEEKRGKVESHPKSWKSLSDEYRIFHAPRGTVDAHHIESGGGWWLKGDGNWIGSLETPEGFTQEHQSILQNQLGHDLRAVRIAAPNTFDLGNERPSDAQLQELNRIFKNSGETDVIWHTLHGDGEGSYGDFLRDVQKHYPEDLVSEEKIKKTPKEEPVPEVSPNEKLQASAQKYAAAHDMPEINHAPVEADPKRAAEIAKIYDEAKHDPNDPRVKAAYDALKAETLAQFKHLRSDLKLKFKPQEEDPYNSAEEMMDDIKKNNTLKVFTGSGTGADHPLSAIAPGTGGQTYNTVFRWVHDAMGHAAGGNDFSENGEKSATEAHAQMYSDLARPAMRAETEGQTSWFFHNPEVESGKAQPGKFAEQKATLLPDVSHDWHETVGKMAATDEAGGINPRTGKPDTKGVGLEIMPESRQPLDHAPTAKDFQKFYAKNQAIFDQYPELRVGFDNASAVKGGHEINVGAVGPNAAHVAARLDQKSAFDIAKGKIIPTGGTGLQTEFKNYPLEQRIKDLNAPPEARPSTGGTPEAPAAPPRRGPAQAKSRLRKEPRTMPWSRDL